MQNRATEYRDPATHLQRIDGSFTDSSSSTRNDGMREASWCFSVDGERQYDRESAAHAHFADCGDFAPQRFDDRAANAESETETGGGIGIGGSAWPGLVAAKEA